MLKESKNPYGYKNLLVYKKAEEMQAACAKLTSTFPSYADLKGENQNGIRGNLKTIVALADQMDRSARSVKQNIVEGWKRNSTKEYYEFLGFSLGANAELEEDCNDIIKGIYKGLQWEKGEKWDQKGVMGEPLSSPLPLEQVERLPFYPIDSHLPPVVKLKLQCKELNFLIHKLQESLAVKMIDEQTLSQNDLLKRARTRRRGDEEWLADFTNRQGMVREKNGRIVPKPKRE